MAAFHYTHNVIIVIIIITTITDGIADNIALPNIDQFSKFLHSHTQQEICNKLIIKDSITP